MPTLPRILALAAFSLVLFGCNEATKPAPIHDGIKIDLSEAHCRANDPRCLNDRLMRRLDEDAKVFGRYDPKLVFGNWRVVAAIERSSLKSLKPHQPFVQIYELRPVWASSQVRISQDAITMQPAANAPITGFNPNQSGALFPTCTKPEFVTDLRGAAAAMEGTINPEQNFGLEYERIGRFISIVCHGSLEYPDDGSGDKPEVTVEEAEGVGSIYIQSPDLLIADWGSLQILLQREGA